MSRRTKLVLLIVSIALTVPLVSVSPAIADPCFNRKCS